MSAAPAREFPSSMAQRLWIYLREMFPLEKNLPLLAVSFLGLYGCTQALAGASTLVFGPLAITGFVSYLGVSLIMRVFDEFKDRELDRVLFPMRPFPRGAVRATDLIALGGTMFALGLVLNLEAGWLIVPYLVAIAYAWLTYKWFFLERQHRTSLLLSLATHQPLGLFVNAYVIAVAWGALHGEPPASLDPNWLLPLFAFFLPVGAWETSRKIRAPEQETDYVTYSSLLGPRRATLLPLAFLLSTCALLLRLVVQLGFADWTFWAIGGVAALYGAVCLRFIAAPTVANNRVRAATEVAAAAIFGVFLEQLFTHRAATVFGWTF